MIKFFRNIRKSLLTENRVSKYLLYAFGEIVLVVIGILIALQINNWNEKRKNKKEEKTILLTVKEDFLKAVDEFKVLNNIRTQTIQVTNKINSLESKNLDKSLVKELFSKTLSSPTFNNKSGSLSVLLSSGKINLIENQKIKELLIEWPGDVEDMIEDEVNAHKLFTDNYINNLSEYVSINELFDGYKTPSILRFDDFTITSSSNNPILTSDYVGLLQNKKFMNDMNRRAIMYSITNVETKSLIEKANHIIQLIDNELKKKND